MRLSLFFSPDYFLGTLIILLRATSGASLPTPKRDSALIGQTNTTGKTHEPPAPSVPLTAPRTILSKRAPVNTPSSKSQHSPNSEPDITPHLTALQHVTSTSNRLSKDVQTSNDGRRETLTALMGFWDETQDKKKLTPELQAKIAKTEKWLSNLDEKAKDHDGELGFLEGNAEYAVGEAEKTLGKLTPGTTAHTKLSGAIGEADLARITIAPLRENYELVSGLDFDLPGG